MSEQSFLVVSTGCLNSFSENTRVSFKNRLAKPAKARKPWVNSLYLDVEQVNFEYTPLYYENDVPDFLYNEVMGKSSYKLPRCYTIDDLVLYLRHPVVTGHVNSNDSNGVKITIQSWYNILIHKKLATFLRVKGYFKESETPDYYILPKGQEYTSHKPIDLNISEINYVDLVCDEISAYFCDGEYKKIIARIDVMNKKEETIHLDTLIRRFYKIEKTSLDSLSFELRQPNGSKLLMKEGPPTIIKAKLKEMSTNANFFYLQVNSQSTEFFPKNNASSFTAELPNEIELKGEWEVAITHAEVPTTERIFTEDARFYHVKTAAQVHLCIMDSNGTYEYKSVGFDGINVISLESFLELIQKMIPNGASKFNIFIDEFGEPKIYAKNANQRIYLLLAPKELGDTLFPSLEKTGMNTVQLTELIKKYPNPFAQIDAEMKVVGWMMKGLSYCYEVLPFSLAPNTPEVKFLFTYDEYYKNDATIKEKIRIKNREKSGKTVANLSQKSEEEENTLLKIHEKKTGSVFTSKTTPTWLFLYSDFVKPTLIADCYSNVIKLIPYKQNSEVNGRFYTFTPLDFFTVNKDRIKTMTFELRTHSGEKHDFRNSKKTTSITLYFRKIES